MLIKDDYKLANSNSNEGKVLVLLFADCVNIDHVLCVCVRARVLVTSDAYLGVAKQLDSAHSSL